MQQFSYMMLCRKTWRYSFIRALPIAAGISRAFILDSVGGIVQMPEIYWTVLVLCRYATISMDAARLTDGCGIFRGSSPENMAALRNFTNYVF